MSNEGVEPTNNRAEQDQRTAVVLRKLTYGTQSPAGSVFVERLLTTVVTLRHQHRGVLDCLTDACRSHLLGQPPPSLLPRLADQNR